MPSARRLQIYRSVLTGTTSLSRTHGLHVSDIIARARLHTKSVGRIHWKFVWTHLSRPPSELSPKVRCANRHPHFFVSSKAGVS